MEIIEQSKIIYQNIKDDKEKLIDNMNQIIQKSIAIISNLKESVSSTFDTKTSIFYDSKIEYDFEYSDVLYDKILGNIPEFHYIEKTVKYYESCHQKDYQLLIHSNPTIYKEILNFKKCFNADEKVFVINKKSKAFPSDYYCVDIYIFSTKSILHCSNINCNFYDEIHMNYYFCENNFSRNILFTIKYLLTYGTGSIKLKELCEYYNKNPSYFSSATIGDIELICQKQKITYENELFKLREKNIEFEKLKKKFSYTHEYYDELKNKYFEFENEFKKYKKYDDERKIFEEERKIFEEERRKFNNERLILNRKIKKLKMERNNFEIEKDEFKNKKDKFEKDFKEVIAYDEEYEDSEEYEESE